MKRAAAAALLLCLLVSFALPSAAVEAATWTFEVIGAEGLGLTGSGVKIAVIDTGVNAAEFEGAKLELYSMIGDDGADTVGHGTLVAGVIAGVAPGAEVVSIKAFKGNESVSDEQIGEAIGLAVELGCKVINMSFGTDSDVDAIRNAVELAAEAGVFIASAAGNDGGKPTPNYPAAYPEALGVGAVTRSKAWAPFSQTNGEAVNASLVAPGAAVYEEKYLSCGTSGTSFACPYVAAAAALLLEQDPELAPAELSCLLQDSAEDLGEAGFDSLYGFGLLRADGALALLAADTGLPYYVSAFGERVYLPLSDGESRYIAPEGVKILRDADNLKLFTDVSGHWAEADIAFAAERELLVGTGGGAFSPDAAMTRAMLVTVLGRIYERSVGAISGSGEALFTDCDYGGWYGGYVDWAAAAGLVVGDGSGHFMPNAKISRGEAATMLCRFAGLFGAKTTGAVPDFPDAASIPNWAREGAEFCREAGIITGGADGLFDSGGEVTRAAAAKMLRALTEYLLGE